MYTGSGMDFAKQSIGSPRNADGMAWNSPVFEISRKRWNGMAGFIWNGLSLAALAAASLVGVAQAQQVDPSKLIPAARTIDRNGVDLMTGQLHIEVPLVAFGEHATGLQSSLKFSQPIVFDLPPLSGFMANAGWVMNRALFPQAHEVIYRYANGVFPHDSGIYYYPPVSEVINPDGSRYKPSRGPGHFTRITSTDPNVSGVYNSQGDRGVGSSSGYSPASPGGGYFDRVVLANGEEWRFYRQYVDGTDGYKFTRLRFAVSSRGFGIQFLYMSDVSPTTLESAGSWFAPRRVTAYNRAFVYCNETLLQECGNVVSLPTSMDISYNITARTVLIRENGSSDGFELQFGSAPAGMDIVSVRHTALPDSVRSFSYEGSGGEGSGTIARWVTGLTDVSGFTDYALEGWTWDWDTEGWQSTSSVTAYNPLSEHYTVEGYSMFAQPTHIRDELNRDTTIDLDLDTHRPTQYTLPNGTRIETQRDDRNNITRIVRHVPPPALDPITVYRAQFPTDCMNPRTCNRPTSVTDANSNVTDYTYAPQHGGVLTETGPDVPTVQANGTVVSIRPQKRFEYAQRTAWVSNGAGGYVAETPIWLLVRERYCRTTAAQGSSCAGGAADEVVTDYDYGPNSGPNNLLLRGLAITAHDGTQIATLRTCYGYDVNGNRISETQPNANLASCS